MVSKWWQSLSLLRITYQFYDGAAVLQTGTKVEQHNQILWGNHFLLHHVIRLKNTVFKQWMENGILKVGDKLDEQRFHTQATMNTVVNKKTYAVSVLCWLKHWNPMNTLQAVHTRLHARCRHQTPNRTR